MSAVYQARSDGSIELGDQPNTLSDDSILDLMNDILNRGAWNAELINRKSSLFEYRINVGSTIFKLYTYVINVSSSSRGRPKEQRIQLNSGTPTEGFDNLGKSNTTVMLLGIYNHDKEPVICAWKPEDKNNYGKQKSCYVNINTISNALRDGFAKRRDGKNHIVCAFKSNFIHYYLMNKDELHLND